MCRTVDEQVTPSCGTVLSHFRSGRRSSGDQWRSQQPKQVSKNVAALFWPLWSLSSSWPLTSFFLFQHPALPQQVPFSITHLQYEDGERHTHVHSKTASIRERTVLYLLWVLCFCFFFTFFKTCSRFISGCSFLTMNCVHRSWVERPTGGILAWGLVWRFSCRAKANLTKTHMHANVNPNQSWWGTHGI